MLTPSGEHSGVQTFHKNPFKDSATAFKSHHFHAQVSGNRFLDRKAHTKLRQKAKCNSCCEAVQFSKSLTTDISFKYLTGIKYLG